MRVGVIIVAAGRGQRLGSPVPKQLLDIGGRSLLRRSVDAFDRLETVSDLAIVLPSDLVASSAQLIGPTMHRYQVVEGGARRQDSVRLGLAALSTDCDVVLVHDAARPFVDAALVARVIEATARTGVAVPAVRARDTVKHVPAGHQRVDRTIPRDEVRLAQTPQGFRRPVIEALMALSASEVEATDEAALAERAGHPVEVVDGDEHNMKITTADDLADARRRVGATPRVGTGYDLHRLVEGRALRLAGVLLPSATGPLGHSDGDVVCHALADAMFGAAGLGDIGQHFPNTDPQWEDVAGLDLLARAVAILADAGWRVSSADVTVVLERPKVAPHVLEIRTRLAEVLGVDPASISVKGKTNEGVDAVGRGEAIASHAVAVLSAGAVS